MKVARVVTACMLVCLLGAPAFSISITNRDDRQHKLTVIVEGAPDQTLTLAPQAVLEGVCVKPCIVRLNDSADDEYELEGTEIVSIEEGYLYYDGPEIAPEQSTPSAGQPGAGQPSAPEAPKKQ